jgi:predicted alpha/beta-fold hydrolase
MPIIRDSDYRSPFWLLNEHWETIIPSIVRKPKKLLYSRERFITTDGDFLDLDFVYKQKNRIAILSHGLEGHSDKYYMRGMARQFIQKGWDTLSWNCRSCSEELNIMPKLYHHGATKDLEEVVDFVSAKGYTQILLIGFSLGGSLVVKYLGENSKRIPSSIVGGIAFSIPCQLGSCAKKLSEPGNKIYLNRFLKKLKNKIKAKSIQFPEIFDLEGIDAITSFYEFDTKYSAPINGFNSAEDFYAYASAGNYIEGIRVPVLLVNSLNDPMFPEDCYPFEAAGPHHYFYLETPQRGGHLGYWWPGMKQSWAELRAYQFVQEVIGIN